MTPTRQTIAGTIRRALRAMLVSPAAVALFLTACATSEDRPPEEEDPYIQETMVYLKTVKPETVSWVRYQEPLRYEVLNNKFVILRTGPEVYLIETERVCRDLTSRDFYVGNMARRNMRGRLRAGVDTLRGCMIATIYRLPGPPPGTSDDESSEQ